MKGKSLGRPFCLKRNKRRKEGREKGVSKEGREERSKAGREGCNPKLKAEGLFDIGANTRVNKTATANG